MPVNSLCKIDVTKLTQYPFNKIASLTDKGSSADRTRTLVYKPLQGI